MTPKDKEDKSAYVKIENANLEKLTIRKMSVLYTDYANFIIELDKLRKQKESLKAKIYKDIINIRDGLKTFYYLLPKEAQKETALPSKKLEQLNTKEREFEFETGLESFETLKKEFEHIRNQLEHIK